MYTSLMFLIFACFTTCFAQEKPFAFINPQTGFALDASEQVLKLQRFTGLPPQQWTLEPERGGKTFIVSAGTGKVLDLDHSREIQTTFLVLNNKIGLDGNYYDYCPQNNAISKGAPNMDACQKWYIHHGGFIVNACGNGAYAVDTRSKNVDAKIETQGYNGGAYQKFEFRYL